MNRADRVYYLMKIRCASFADNNKSFFRSKAKFFLAILFACIVCTQPGAAKPTSKRQISELLLNAANGKVIYAVRPDALHHPASLTKMMTLYLVFDALDEGLLREDKKLIISKSAARQPPSNLGFRPGDTITVRDAMRAAAVHSANDVAVALAESLGGDESNFVKKMNIKAHNLGMTHTKFANVTGLTNSGNITTAHDMSLLARALIKHHSQFYRIFNTRSFVWRSQRIFNHNHLLGKVSGVDGIKTGYTADAGFNIVTSGKRHRDRIIAIVLGAPSISIRDVRVANLLELGFISQSKSSSSGLIPTLDDHDSQAGFLEQ